MRFKSLLRYFQNTIHIVTPPSQRVTVRLLIPPYSFPTTHRVPFKEPIILSTSDNKIGL